LLGVGRRYVGLRRQGGEVRILDLADPSRVIALGLKDTAGRVRHPVHAAFCGARALLLHARVAQDRTLTEPILTAFALPGAETLWERGLADESAGPCRIGRIEIFGGTAALTVAPIRAGSPARQVVLSATTGVVSDCGSVLRDAGLSPVSRCPAVMNGRVVAEHAEGIACLAGAEP
jgi:hypothetical protein